MIIKGRSRSGPAELAAHLMRTDTNERVEIFEIRGVVASDLTGALKEMDAVAAGARAKRSLYHASVNTRSDELMTPAQWSKAVDSLEARLGLVGQPRAVVIHDKVGRQHLHVVWSRIKAETMTAVSDSLNYRAHEEVARELEREFGHHRVQGAHAERDGVQRPSRTALLSETQQAARTKVDLIACKQRIREAWRSTETGDDLRQALEKVGLTLAVGSRRCGVVVDTKGNVFSLARAVPEIRAKDVRARMAQVCNLPSATEIRHAFIGLGDGYQAKSDLATAETTIDDLFKRQSYINEGDIELALRSADLECSPAIIRSALSKGDMLRLQLDGHLVGYTKRAIRNQEIEIVQRARVLAEARGPKLLAGAVAIAIRDGDLDAQQAAAVQHIANGGGLAIIEGRAGTGKSHTLSAIRRSADTSGYAVVGLAPTNSVAQDLARDGFTGATTIHSLLWYLDHAPEHPKCQADWRTLFVVDEAAMLDSDTLDKFTRHLVRTGAKAVLVGDDRQLGSIQRGGLFTDLVIAIGSAKLTTVRRQQQGWARQASTAFAEGDFQAGIAAYDDKGLVKWCAQLDDARAALVQAWREDTKEQRGRRLAFAYTNVEVRRLNDALQAIEIEQGRVKSLVEVETEVGTVKVGAGDRILFRGTDKKAGIFNGALATIEDISSTGMRVRSDTGRQIQVSFKEFTNFDLGYAATIYKGQGKTLDQTYLLHTRHWQDAAAYVAMTRARNETKMFVATDQARDLTELAGQFSQQMFRGSTLRFHVAEEVGTNRLAANEPLATRQTVRGRAAALLGDRNVEQEQD